MDDTVTIHIEPEFQALLAFLEQIPSVHFAVGHGRMPSGNWWVKLKIDIAHPLAWLVVQTLGWFFNYISVNDRLPTVFMPVSAAPYLNGGPKEFLSWVIEAKDASFTPDIAAEWLRTRLPSPVDDLAQWNVE